MLFRYFRHLVLLVAGVLFTALVFSTGAFAGPLSPMQTRMASGADQPLVIKVRVREAGVRRRLRNAGYTNITIIDRRAPGFIVKACQDGKRYRVSVHRRGRIVEREHIGRCGNRKAGGHGGLRPPQIRKDLRERGFEDIRFLDRELPVYVVTACKTNRRFRLRMNRWGKISKRQNIGRCGFGGGRDDATPVVRPRRDDGIGSGGGRHAGDNKRPPQIRKMLQRRGFNQIKFIDRRLPTYVVRACKNERRMELRIDGSGWIRKRERLGRCGVANEGMKPPQIRQTLRTRGFSRIKFTDRQLPVYVVEACRHDRKFELRLNRFARVMKKSNIGRCREERAERGYEPRQVREILRRRGYREINFFDRDLPRYGVTACKRGQKFRMKLNRFAEIKQRRRTGFCRPRVSAPPVQVDDYEEVDEEEISGTERIDPETCQTYLDALVRRNRIHFDVASASLRRGSYGLLRRLSRVMNRCPSSRIEISGHTDSDGSHAYNRDLSRRRAKTVAGFLAQKGGISLRRMTAYGYGEEQPLMAYERTQRDKARNRRIEFTVIWGDDDDDDRRR